MPVELVWGLLGLTVMVVLWVVLPHHIHQKHNGNRADTTPARTTTVRSEAESPQSADPHVSHDSPDTAHFSNRHVAITRTAALTSNVSPTQLNVRIMPGRNAYHLHVHAPSKTFVLPVRSAIERCATLRRERFSTEILGIPMQTCTLQSLITEVQHTLETLASGAHLPEYGLQTEQAVWPVYVQSGKWMLHDPDGPIVEAPTLETLRIRWADCLRMPRSAITPVMISSDLRWVPPVGYVQSRSAHLQRLPIFFDGCLVHSPIGVDTVTIPLPPNPLSLLKTLMEFCASRAIFPDGSGPAVCTVASALWPEEVFATAVFHTQLKFYTPHNGRLHVRTLPVLEDRLGYVAIDTCNPETYALFVASSLAELRQWIAGWLIQWEDTADDHMFTDAFTIAASTPGPFPPG